MRRRRHDRSDRDRDHANEGEVAVEMSLKQAQNIAKQRVQELRAWEKVEAVLNAALGAELREVQANERVRALTESAGKWEAAVEEARTLYNVEHTRHVVSMQRRVDAHATAMVDMREAAEARQQEITTEIEAALVEAEEKQKALTAACRALEEQRETLEGKLKQARDAHAAMLKKLGVTNG